MHISNIPIKLFKKILEYIPLRNASEIMLVNKEWYREYRAIIYNQRDAKFEELLYSQQSDWKNISAPWDEFILRKLYSYCDNFDIFYLRPKLLEIYESLDLKLKKLNKKREATNKLMAHYEASPDFEGWFPDWLWKQHKEPRWDSIPVILHKGHVLAVISVLKETIKQAWFHEMYGQSL